MAYLGVSRSLHSVSGVSRLLYETRLRRNKLCAAADVERPKGGCRLRARLDVRRGLNAARPSHAMHSLGLSMSRKRAPCLPKAGPCFDSTTRQDMFWGRAGMNAWPRWGKRAVYAALNSCSTPPTVAPRANAIPLPFGTHEDNRLRSSHMLVASPAAPAPTS